MVTGQLALSAGRDIPHDDPRCDVYGLTTRPIPRVPESATDSVGPRLDVPVGVGSRVGPVAHANGESRFACSLRNSSGERRVEVPG
jgi:hypothetical protein